LLTKISFIDLDSYNTPLIFGSAKWGEVKVIGFSNLDEQSSPT
jgi:hypothetical protein